MRQKYLRRGRSGWIFGCFIVLVVLFVGVMVYWSYKLSGVMEKSISAWPSLRSRGLEQGPWIQGIVENREIFEKPYCSEMDAKSPCSLRLVYLKSHKTASSTVMVALTRALSCRPKCRVYTEPDSTQNNILTLSNPAEGKYDALVQHITPRGWYKGSFDSLKAKMSEIVPNAPVWMSVRDPVGHYLSFLHYYEGREDEHPWQTVADHVKGNPSKNLQPCTFGNMQARELGLHSRGDVEAFLEHELGTWIRGVLVAEDLDRTLVYAAMQLHLDPRELVYGSSLDAGSDQLTKLPPSATATRQFWAKKALSYQHSAWKMVPKSVEDWYTTPQGSSLGHKRWNGERVWKAPPPSLLPDSVIQDIKACNNLDTLLVRGAKSWVYEQLHRQEDDYFRNQLQTFQTLRESIDRQLRQKSFLLDSSSSPTTPFEWDEYQAITHLWSRRNT